MNKIYFMQGIYLKNNTVFNQCPVVVLFHKSTKPIWQFNGKLGLSELRTQRSCRVWDYLNILCK